MVTGSLLGLVKEGTGVLEVTHAFPNPDWRQQQQMQQQQTDDDGNTVTDGGFDESDFQMDMMRMLREVNVDNNCVGWYQSMYLGIYSTTNVLENQLSYQTDLSPNAVVLLYDPLQTTNGNFVLRCLRLKDTTVEHRSKDSNAFIPPSQLFEQVPIKLTNPGLVRAYLAASTSTTTAAAAAATTGGTKTSPLSLDRLDLSTNPYLEKHLEFLCSWVDDLAMEQQKFQYYARQVARDKKNSRARDRDGTSSTQADIPRRMESLLIANQIQAYVDQMDNFTGAGLSKLYLTGGLHREKTTTTTTTTTTGGGSTTK
jgi:translation initiation factor 3 subunit H